MTRETYGTICGGLAVFTIVTAIGGACWWIVANIQWASVLAFAVGGVIAFMAVVVVGKTIEQLLWP